MPHAADAGAPAACAELPVGRVRPTRYSKTRLPPCAWHEDLIVRPGGIGLDRIAKGCAAVGRAVQHCGLILLGRYPHKLNVRGG